MTIMILSRRAIGVYAISSAIFFCITEVISKRALLVAFSPSSGTAKIQISAGAVTNATGPSCQRRCPKTRGKIYYAEYTDGGLDDRIYVITALANLASFFCAELILKPPAELLQPYHNNLQQVSAALEWADFSEAVHVHDGSHFALRSEREEFGRALAEERPKSCYSCPNGADKCHWKMQRFDKKCVAFDSTDAKYKDWEHVVTTFGSDHLDDFRRVFARAWDEKTKGGFLWEIHMSYWLTPAKNNDVLKEMAPPSGLDKATYLDMLPAFESSWPPVEFGEGCTYIRVDYSATIRQMQQSLLSEIKRQALDDASIGLLHLRRADAMKDCDTSVPKLWEYLTCSLANVEGLHANITMILTTDERDEGYRGEVMELVRRSFGGHMTMLDGDAIARRVVDEAVESGRIAKGMVNNFVTFAVEAPLRTGDLIDFRFTRRRKSCPDCEPVQSVDS